MKVLTANRLSDGVVVYIGAGEAWVEDLALAAVVTDEAGETRLQAAAAAAIKARQVVGAYLMPATVEDGKVLPVSVRERIRAAGPSNRTDLGKQADRPAAAAR
ncbi:DUF2849 domain-containing protein [Zavarzinia compransoris]|uniref:DUF2849 domain-containing protein n=1 Tax=Zavarzinia compransoris TaxID=1264899 RepID=A0A317EE42_9PROT|nr:DUF2849 domain-containing protein [Zavarzinia compransoris]PWR23485.1 DUF2849 domain-containing protein [Zavarzinia compransoris]TDP45932.1 uncharacterized protein DUF2849 [Zavarzinia compransoris]